MYSCVLWSGSHLPLPKMDKGQMVRDESWVPLFASKDDIPLFWWFLLDRFNCFWLADGTPIFVVDRAGALARANARYVKVEEVLLPEQRQIWRDFCECLKACKGDIFNIQVPQLWHHKFLSNTNLFNSYMKKSLLPLEVGSFGTRQQQEQRRQSMTAHFEQTGTEPSKLSGELLIPA